MSPEIEQRVVECWRAGYSIAYTRITVRQRFHAILTTGQIQRIFARESHRA